MGDFTVTTGIESIRNRRGLPKWLITTAHRVCRRMRDRAGAPGPTSGVPLDALEHEQPPAESVAQWEQQHVVRQTLARLGDNHRADRR